MPPTVLTGSASSIGQTAAVLNATVNPNGGAVTECRFEYGATSAYGASEACSPSPGSGTGPVAVAASVAGLNPAASYHFRIVATNAGGTRSGGDETLTTQPLPTLLSQIPGVPTGSRSQGVLPAQEYKRPIPDAKLSGGSLMANPYGIVAVRVTCPAAESRCTGTIALRTLTAVLAGTNGHKRSKAAILTLAAGAFNVPGGGVTTVKLHLSAKARAVLKRTRVLRVRAIVVAHDAAGATHTSQTTLTLRVARTKRGR